MTLAAAILCVPLLFLTSTGRTFLGRSTEFSSNESSGNLRFVAPIVRLVNTFDAHYLIGHGPGTIEEFANIRNVARKNDRHLVYSFGYSYIKEVEAYPNTLLTILFELGIFPGAPLMLFICYCFFRRVWSYPVSIAMFMYLMLLAGDFSQVETVLLCYALSFMSIRPLVAAETAIREFTARRPVSQHATAFSPSVALR
jgi:O-antigen ligase